MLRVVTFVVSRELSARSALSVMSVSNARTRSDRTLLVRNERRSLIELVLSGSFVLFSFLVTFMLWPLASSCLDSFYISGVGVGSRMGFFMYCGHTVIH